MLNDILSWPNPFCSCRKTLEEMNADAQRRIEDLLLQLREDKEEIKYHIYASIEEPPDRKPVEFQDATGRQFHVPLELCQRFDVRFPRVPLYFNQEQRH